MFSQCAALQGAWYHDKHLFINIYPCMCFDKIEGEIDTEQFIEEIRKYDCFFIGFRKEFKDKFRKINALCKLGEVFSISPAAAEKKFHNVRTAYGRYLKCLKSFIWIWLRCRPHSTWIYKSPMAFCVCRAQTNSFQCTSTITWKWEQLFDIFLASERRWFKWKTRHHPTARVTWIWHMRMNMEKKKIWSFRTLYVRTMWWH